MNKNDSEDSTYECASPESEITRKRKRNTWTLTGRQTDKETLLEMGLGILTSEDDEAGVDSDNQIKPPKRKRNLENLDPNTSQVSPKVRKSISPTKSNSPVSVLTDCNVRNSPQCSSDSKHPNQLFAWESSETLELHSEDTPVPQLPVRSQYTVPSPKLSYNERPSTSDREVDFENKLLEELFNQDTSGVDSFSELSDEVMLSIFKWLPKINLADCMLVCKRWNRIATDETLWQRIELGNKDILKDAIGKILTRKPYIVRLAGSQIGEWTNTTGYNNPSKIQYLDLSMCTVNTSTLNGLLEKCPELKKLSLEFVSVNEYSCRLIGRCSKMESLNLAMCEGITSNGMESIVQGCTSLQSLNVSWCNLDECSLEAICNFVSTRLLRLNLSGNKQLTNKLITDLCIRTPRLLELDVSDAGSLSGHTLNAIRPLRALQHLALSRCYHIPLSDLSKLNEMVSLQYLEIWGTFQTHAFATLQKNLPSIQINQFMHRRKHRKQNQWSREQSPEGKKELARKTLRADL